MPETFPLADVLTVTTGRLLSHDHMDGLYRILNYLTGDNLMTHQLGRAAETCRPALIRQHPWLADVAPPEDIDMPDLFAWLAAQESIHGDALILAPIADWRRVDPIGELVARFGPERVIVVDVSGGGES
jgi:hypothetical protein